MQAFKLQKQLDGSVYLQVNELMTLKTRGNESLRQKMCAQKRSMNMKKVFGLMAVLALGIITLTGCGGVGDVYDDLVGTWEWDTLSSTRLVLEDDGTGSWTGIASSLEWGVRGGELRINIPAGTTRWNFDISGDALHIDRAERSVDEAFTYYRAGREEEIIEIEEEIEEIDVDQPADDVEVEEVDSGLSTNDFVGTWNWDLDGSFQLILEADGTGNWVNHHGDITWEYTNGELRIVTSGMTERWQPTIEGNTLTMSSLQVEGLEYVYILQ